MRLQKDINAALENWKSSGFINYFGLQRFGTSGVPTHAVGRAVVGGDWKGAVELILKVREGEPQYVRDARQLFWEAGDRGRPERTASEDDCRARRARSMIKNGKTNYVAAIRGHPANAPYAIRACVPIVRVEYNRICAVRK